MAEPLATPILEEEELEEAQLEDAHLLAQIQSYIQESEAARKSGHNPRDDVWSDNIKAYWASYDYSNKEEWQSKLRLSDFANFVDRFAASLSLVFSASPDPFDVRDIKDPKQTAVKLIEQTTRTFLDHSGTNASGQTVGFSTTFRDTVKSGALMAMAASVRWSDGRIRIDPVDPRECFFDPSGRGNYRIRRYEVDKWKLEKMARDLRDSDGNPIYDLQKIQDLDHAQGESTDDKEESSGSSGEITASGRKPIVLHEFLGVVTTRDGELLAKGQKQLVVVANERSVIRGPEPNPMKHGRDWIVFCPLIRVPFSVYHKSFAEGFKELGAAFIELTNMILDAVYSSTMPMHQGWPTALEDEAQMREGAHPNKIWWADAEEVPIGTKFMIPVEPPKFPAEAIPVWQGVKNEMREAASQNELRLGQLARGEKTATEIGEARAGTQTLVQDLAEIIDDHFFGPILELTWLTAVQHLTDNREQETNGKILTDEEILAELGPKITSMIIEQREDFLKRRFRFKAKAIRGVLERSQRLRGLLAALSVIGENEMLQAAFVERFSVASLIEVILTDMGVDTERLEKAEEDRAQDRLRNLLSTGGGGGRSAPQSPSDRMASILTGLPGAAGTLPGGGE